MDKATRDKHIAEIKKMRSALIKSHKENNEFLGEALALRKQIDDHITGQQEISRGLTDLYRRLSCHNHIIDQRLSYSDATLRALADDLDIDLSDLDPADDWKNA